MSDDQSAATPAAGDDPADLFENAPCGFLVLSHDGRISKVNRTLCTWTGYSPADFLGKRVHQFLNMAGRIYFETHVAPLLRMQGSFSEFAIDFMTRDGERVPLLANAVEHRGPDGAPLSTRFAVIKGTDRRRFERDLVVAKANVSASLASERETANLREQFIAVLGHDLRNPLWAIGAGAEMLLRSNAARDEKEIQLLGMINATVSRMSGLLDDVLDFARGRLGAGIDLSNDSSILLQPMLEQVVEELRTGSPARRIETNIDVSDLFTCDVGRIGQLASNLIGNALAHGAPEKPVRVEANTHGGVFALWVANAGVPIPEEALGKLFEPFFRGEARDSRQGLGLGLYIASQIAQAHGGQLAVRSTTEETRFTFTMPLRPGPGI